MGGSGEMQAARNHIVEALHAIADAGMYLRRHAGASRSPQERMDLMAEVAGLEEASGRLEGILERSGELAEAGL